VKSEVWKSEAHKRHVWEFFEMSQRNEVDAESVPYIWHWIMHPMCDLLGPELVYAVGLKALEYPPTWVDTKKEADLVEAAIDKFLD
jgi:hypothetical protein